MSQAGRLLPGAASGGGGGKYDVSRPRKLEGGLTTDPRNAEITEGMRLLDAA